MKINLDMAKKLNLKATQGQESENKILVEKSIKKAAFERNLDSNIYCWTHGFKVTKGHSSQTCLLPATGHQRTASRKYIMGVRKAGK